MISDYILDKWKHGHEQLVVFFCFCWFVYFVANSGYQKWLLTHNLPTRL